MLKLCTMYTSEMLGAKYRTALYKIIAAAVVSILVKAYITMISLRNMQNTTFVQTTPRARLWLALYFLHWFATTLGFTILSLIRMPALWPDDAKDVDLTVFFIALPLTLGAFMNNEICQHLEESQLVGPLVYQRNVGEDDTVRRCRWLGRWSFSTTDTRYESTWVRTKGGI